MASTIRGHLVAALETRMILWVGLEFGKGLAFHAEYILNILYSFQHDMKTFSDFPTRVAFWKPSKCLQVPSKTSAFLKICNFFYKKQLNQVLTNWRHRCVCHKSSAYDQESNSKCTFYGDCNKLEITDYGRPMKPFFIEILNFWALADNLGRYILGHFRYFRPIYQHPFW